mmetsp:Transcript_24953/g.54841  ORF Transcript_24953/g.54841 Transcript_24953/m.54841 type:complete len:288 (-) Transcript_24953:1454-2317(-)
MSKAFNDTAEHCQGLNLDHIPSSNGAQPRIPLHRGLPRVHHRHYNPRSSTLLLRDGFFFPNLPRLGCRTPHDHAQPASRPFHINEVARWRRVRPRSNEVKDACARRDQNSIGSGGRLTHTQNRCWGRYPGPLHRWLSHCNCSNRPCRGTPSIARKSKRFGCQVNRRHFFQRQIIIIVVPPFSKVIIIFFWLLKIHELLLTLHWHNLRRLASKPALRLCLDGLLLNDFVDESVCSHIAHFWRYRRLQRLVRRLKGLLDRRTPPLRRSGVLVGRWKPARHRPARRRRHW